MIKGQLIFIGLGLYCEKDISLKGLEEIKKSDKVFAEFYTSKLVGSDIKKIEEEIGKKIQVLSREKTEKGDLIIESAKKQKTIFLTAGDSMTATTHVDLRIRAIKEGIETKVIHSSSIVTAVSGLLGLQNYKFGRTTTLAYPEKNYFPTSPYDIIEKNKKIGLHTLVLLDIQEEKNRYMTANEGLNLLLDMEKKLKKNLIKKDTIACVVARAGSSEPIIRADCIKELINFDFGEPLHTIVIPGDLHFMEIEALKVLAQLPAQQIRKLQKV
jgi:diphthine synthase